MDSNQQRKHVTRKQMQRLERGESVILNHNQFKELCHYAPKWVEVSHQTDGTFFIVTIRDTRDDLTRLKQWGISGAEQAGT